MINTQVDVEKLKQSQQIKNSLGIIKQGILNRALGSKMPVNNGAAIQNTTQNNGWGANINA
ncbi:MAG: hypothetical protein MJ174_07435 [Treponema sp.]|nr:hypothetical protein [Treponema sp.]